MKRRKNIRQFLVFLDLGQSANGANPDDCAKSDTAEKIKGDRHHTAGMQWSVACGVKRNEAVLWM